METTNLALLHNGKYLDSGNGDKLLSELSFSEPNDLVVLQAKRVEKPKAVPDFVAAMERKLVIGQLKKVERLDKALIFQTI